MHKKGKGIIMEPPILAIRHVTADRTRQPVAFEDDRVMLRARGLAMSVAINCGVAMIAAPTNR
jgi:hypothetical protein